MCKTENERLDEQSLFVSTVGFGLGSLGLAGITPALSRPGALKTSAKMVNFGINNGKTLALRLIVVLLSA